MRHLVRAFGLVAILITLNACDNSIKPAPSWIHNPGDGAVGSATTHVRGRHYQEELAIGRARERLAARYGVAVNSIQTIRERIVNETAYVTSDKEIHQQIQNAVVKAHVRETWHDKGHDEIWVWVYPVAN
ncbi:MAG: hypothetical protein OQL06_14040 [Gammaproteobacteria bacterium]|nr:hypothetical protein [Gammaproteobacteria bacterium]